MWFVPFWIYIVFQDIYRDPSYTKSVVSKRSVASEQSEPVFQDIYHDSSYTKSISKRSVTSEQSKHVDRIVWSNSYHAKGVISFPLTNINENFEAWYDSNMGGSRIDYQNGKTKTYQFANVGSFGLTFKVLRNDTGGKENNATCFCVRGNKKFPITSQSILPDPINFKLENQLYSGNKKLEYWVYKSVKGNKSSSHSLWLVKKKNMNYPLRYEVNVTNTEFRLLLDSYVISYDFFLNTDIHPDIFNSLKDCELDDETGSDNVYSLNPMKELIDNYEDNYYYVDPIFKEFNLRRNKIYKNDSLEYIERKKIFHNNLRYIHWKNRGNFGYTLAMNQFTDRYPKELFTMFAYENLNDKYLENNIFRYNKNNFKNIPTEFNWYNRGAVTSVKNQSVCGAGWSYAITGAVEGAYFLRNRYLKRFSTQALIDCTWRQIKNDCGNGRLMQALELIKNEGIPTEEDYGLYPSQDGTCHMDIIPNKNLTKITNYKIVKKFTSYDEDVLKLALVNYGPIAISIHASPTSFIFYSNGIYYDHECRNGITDLNHSALLVGYGTMKDIPYWIVKNSWTTEFGSSGYILISRKDNMCGVQTSPTFVVL